MYLPYLRVRQFELLALRELVENGLIGERVIPVVEPIKISPTLSTTLKIFEKKGHNISIVMNPTVGDLVSDIPYSDAWKKLSTLFEDEAVKKNIIKSYVMNSVGKQYIADSSERDIIAVNPNRDCLKIYLELFSEFEPAFSLIPDDRKFSRKVKQSKVLFEDHFLKAKRNKDYQDRDDELFSEDHLFYKEEQFLGFSDYSVVGEEFSESGFAPIAVAIHIVYFDDDDSLRIHHFVSDSNEDINDPAKKFGEAVAKLYDWVKEQKIQQTKGLQNLIDCYKAGRYPGLGTVKKYSIMHHIELMNNFLEAH